MPRRGGGGAARPWLGGGEPPLLLPGEHPLAPPPPRRRRGPRAAHLRGARRRGPPLDRNDSKSALANSTLHELSFQPSARRSTATRRFLEVKRSRMCGAPFGLS